MGINFSFNPLDALSYNEARQARDENMAMTREFREQDRRWYIRDRRNQRAYDARTLQRLVRDAKHAGIHPLAAMGAQVAGPAQAFQSQHYQGDSYTPSFSGGASYQPNDALYEANVKLVQKQADLVEQQIQDSVFSRMKEFLSNDANAIPELAKPYQVTPQTHTPVINSPVGTYKTDPSLADAETLTKRYGEGELFENALAAIMLWKDWAYNKTGLTNAMRTRLNEFKKKMATEEADKQVKRKIRNFMFQ